MRPGGGVLPSKRLLGMCRWMGSYFHNWTDHNGVKLLIELLKCGRKFLGFLGEENYEKQGFKVGRFAVENGSCCCFDI